VKAGWQTTPFEDCIEQVTYTTKIQRKDFLSEGAFPIVSQEEDLINGRWENEADLFRVERPLVLFGDHTRSFKYVDFDFVLGADGVKILKPKAFLHPRYFYFQLQTAKLESLGYARHFRLLKEHRVSYPDLAEQHRIVTLLDEAFTDIATAKANAEKNLQNARELFESHLDAIVTSAQANGEIVPLTELATDITDGDHMPPPKVEQGLPFITIGNIDKQTRAIDFSDTFQVPREYFDGLKANKKPMRGDVLYTVTGSFGIPVLVEDDKEFCFQRHIGLIRPKADVDSTWLHYLLQSSQVFKQAADGATGTAQKTVSLKVLRNLQVPKISPTQQSAHVETLRNVESECRHLESIYRQKLTALDDLKKSLLHQAFSGQL
jgi:restriction endonuclease S subunit